MKRFIPRVLSLAMCALSMPFAIAQPITAGADYTLQYGFALAWSDRDQQAVVSEIFTLPVVPTATLDADAGTRASLLQSWGDTLIHEPDMRKTAWNHAEIVGWYDSRPQAEAQRARRKSYLEDRIKYTVTERFGGIIGKTREIQQGSLIPTFRDTREFSITTGGLVITGRITCRAQFSFFSYPYLKAEYGPLVIEEVYWEQPTREQLSRNDMRRFMKFPITIVKGGQHMDVIFNVYTPAPSKLDELLDDMKVATTPVDRWEGKMFFPFRTQKLTTLTDTFENAEVDQFFKDLNIPNIHDSTIWEASWLDRVDPFTVKGISDNILHNIKLRIEQATKKANESSE